MATEVRLSVDMEPLGDILDALSPEEFVKGVHLGLKMAATAVHRLIAKYPPPTIANSPANPTGRWYQRGYGPKWRRKDGSIGGRKTSQQLGQSWALRLGPWQVHVGTKVTYAPFVQSETHQAAFHKRTGWQTDYGVAKSMVETGELKALMEQGIYAVWEKHTLGHTISGGEANNG